MKYTKLRSIASIVGVLIALAAPAWADVTVEPPDTEIREVTEVRDALATTLSVLATTSGPKPIYEWWYKENSEATAKTVASLSKPKNYSGQDSATLKISAANSSLSGLYFCRVYENVVGGGTNVATSAVFPVNVNVRPVIKTQPKVAAANLNPANQGARVEILAELQSDATIAGLNYRWVKDGVYVTPVTAATSTTLKYVIPEASEDPVAPGVQLSNAGTYKVEIDSTKTATKITSKTFALKVNSAPVILKQPAAETGGVLHIATGGSGKLSVVAGGNAKLRYKWVKVGSETVLGTASSLTLKATATTNIEGQYQVTVTNDFPVANTNTVSLPASVVVLNKPTEATPISVIYSVDGAPVQTTRFVGEADTESPQLRELTLTANPSLTDTSTEADPLEFQWQKDGKNIYNGDSVLATEPATPGVTGAKTATIKFSPLSWNHRGVYRCVIKNKVAVLTTKTFTLDVKSKPVEINPTGPLTQVGVAGKTTVFSVVAGGTGPLKYQWKKDGVALGKGSTAAKFTVAALADLNQGVYTCEITNNENLGILTSSAITLRVDTAAKISVQPKAQVVMGPAAPVLGDTISLSITTSDGDGPVTYQWQKNNKDLKDSDDPRMSNSQLTALEVGTATLTITNATLADAGTYRCLVTNAAGLVKLTSAAVKVTVLGRPQITVPPASQEVYEYSTVTLSVKATGSSPLKYEWYFKKFQTETFEPVTGGTAAALILKNIRFSTHQGEYMCKVYNGTLPTYKAESAVATLTVNAIPDSEVLNITPKKARKIEKVRVSGNNLNFVDEVWFGEKGLKTSIKAGFVYEPISESLLLTVPANLVKDQGYILTLVSVGGGVKLTTGTDTVTRVEYQANDRDNPTILVGSTFPKTIGQTFADSPNGVRPEAVYEWYVPKAGIYELNVYGFLFQMKVNVKSETRDTTYNSEKNKSAVLRDITFTEPGFVTFTISGADVAGSNLNKVGTYNIACTYSAALPAGTPTATADSAGSTDVSASSWVMDGATASFADESQTKETSSASFTGSSAKGVEPTVLWQDTSDVVTTADSVIHTEWSMSIDQAGAGTDGHFGWQVSAADGSPLGQLRFSVSDGKIFTVTADGTATLVAPYLVAGSTHRFEIATDLGQGTWQARMDGVAIGEPIPVSQGSVFGDVSVIWYPASSASAKPTMTFDGVKISVD